MTDEVLQKLISAVQEGTFQPDFWFYFSIFAVISVASGLGVYLASYFGQKGQNLATKEDFQQLLDQQQQTTKVTEQARTFGNN